MVSPITAQAFDVLDQVTTALVATVTISCDTIVNNVTCESVGELTSDLVNGETEMSNFMVYLLPSETVVLDATLSYLTPEDRTATHGVAACPSSQLRHGLRLRSKTTRSHHMRVL